MARRVLLASGVVLLGAFAYAPVLRAGLLGTDLALFLGAGGEGAERPLTRVSLALSRAGWSALGAVPAAGPRLENLALVGLAALGLAAFARRALQPWLGREQAARVAAVAAVLLLLHPLSPPVVAALSARGALLATALGALALAAFLRGRQERRLRWTAGSFALVALAGFASRVILGLAPLLVLAELCSSRRPRPLRVRLRTSFTTLVVFLGAASIEPALRVLRAPAGPLSALAEVLGTGPRGTFRAPLRPAELAERVVEKLGLLALPCNPEVVGAAGLCVAGVLVLVAVAPALEAARTAPRLWGWLAVLGLAALFGALSLQAPVRVVPSDLAHVAELLPALMVVALALATAASAAAGLGSRSTVPALLAAGFAALGHANALPWPAAARAARAARADLLRAVELHGLEARYFLVDPPRPVRGVDPLGPPGPWLARRDLRGLASEPRVAAPTLDAFLLFARQPEFRALRQEGPVVAVVAQAALGLGESAAGPPVERGVARRSVLLPPPSAPTTMRSWRGDPTSPALDLDAFEFGALRVQVPEGTRLAANDVVGWSAPRSSVSEGRLRGVWVGGGIEPVCVFDLGASLAWRLGGRIRSIRVEGDLLRLTQADLAADLPALGSGLAPRESAADWRFAAPSAPLPLATDADGPLEHHLLLLELESLRCTRLRALSEGSELVVPGAGRWVRDARGTVAWSLDFLAGERTIARSSGRVEGGPPTLP